AASPSATVLTSSTNSRYVQRRPDAQSTSASRSGKAVTVRSRFAPMLSPSWGTSVDQVLLQSRAGTGIDFLLTCRCEIPEFGTNGAGLRSPDLPDSLRAP